MKNSLFVLAFVLISASVFAQGGVAISANSSPSTPAVTESESVTLKGTLEKKPWSKSTQSYCAQGSDYYTLTTGKQEHVLQLENIKTKRLKRKLGTTVELRGKFVTRTITPDPNSQHPVSTNPVTGEDDADFECTVFVVERVGK